MTENNLRKGLKIKNVGVRYLDQYNDLLKYVFQVTQKQLDESGYEDGELIRSKRPVLQEADVFGWFTPEDKLISQICIYPCQVNIHNKIYKMGGVTGVGTYPEYANLGLMNDLIKLALEKMCKNGQYISYLFPYSIPYYRRKGWEIMSDHMTFRLYDTQLPKKEEVPGIVKRESVKHPDVIAIYDLFSRQNHGALIRNTFEWAEYWRWEDEDERIAAIYYNEENIPGGYLLYWIDNDQFHIKEMIYLHQEARKGLWNFINAHYSMIDEVRGEQYVNDPLSFLLDDSQITETIEPYYMARIVDVKEFLSIFPFIGKIKPFHFLIEDPIASWNNGIFAIIPDKSNNFIVSDVPEGKEVKLNIQTLSAMLMSYRRPGYLYKIERLITDPETLKLLEEIIPDQQPYFSDYF